MSGVSPSVAAALVVLVQQLEDQVVALSARLGELEARPAPERGEQGPVGERGPEGQRGPQGEVGSEGPRGFRGDTGVGETGPAGDTGPRGDQGPRGEQGARGPRGERGATGDTGAAGDSGRIVTNVVGAGIGRTTVQGMIEEALADLPGGGGGTGATGATGPKGDAGDPGAKGDTGDEGPKGDTGDQGPKGDTGDAGADGADGATGAAGSALLHLAMALEDGMYTLSATDSIGAVASADAVINFKFDGVRIDASGVPTTVGGLPGGVLSNSAATIWPPLAPGGTVARLTLFNTSAAPVDITLFRNGTTDALLSFQVPADGSAIWTGGRLNVYTDTGAPIT